jgi:hypothetical protein
MSPFELNRDAWARDTEAFREAMQRLAPGKDLGTLSKQERCAVMQLAQKIKDELNARSSRE